MIKAAFPCDITRHPRLAFIAIDDNSHVLNVGAGINPLYGEGVVNADSVPKPGIDVVFDVRQTWPFPDHTFTKVVAFQILEHINPLDGLHFMKEARRVLKPKHLLIIEVPDVLKNARDLVEGNWGALRPIYSGGLLERNSEPEQDHRWGYDASSLWLLATLAGFYQGITLPGTDYHSHQMATVRLEVAA